MLVIKLVFGLIIAFCADMVYSDHPNEIVMTLKSLDITHRPSNQPIYTMAESYKIDIFFNLVKSRRPFEFVMNSSKIDLNKWSYKLKNESNTRELSQSNGCLEVSLFNNQPGDNDRNLEAVYKSTVLFLGGREENYGQVRNCDEWFLNDNIDKVIFEGLDSEQKAMRTIEITPFTYTMSMDQDQVDYNSSLHNNENEPSPITFSCAFKSSRALVTTRGSPKFYPIWYRGTQENISHDNSLFEINTVKRHNEEGHVEIFSNLTITKPVLETTGNYSCIVRFHTHQSEDMNLAVSAFFIGPPKIAPFKSPGSTNVKNKVQGEDLTLHCRVSGFPIDNLTWTKDGKIIEAREGVSFESVNGSPRLKLKIKNINFSESGVYECFASSHLGNDSATITVNVKDRLAALVPFICICVEVCILCIIIFFWERRHKQHLEKEAAAQQQQESANGPQPQTPLKIDEIRQRNSSK